MQDRKQVTVEAIITGEKAMFDCPIRLFLYGPSDPALRASLETRLKEDRLIKATELKRTKAEADRQRARLGLKSGSSTAGLGSSARGAQPEVRMEDLLKDSNAVDFRMADGDAIKNLAMNEDQLSQMPLAAQPDALQAKLLPYQLQVISMHIHRQKVVLILAIGPGMVDRKGEP
jgi:SWI/SNF-related matrix-associated actin-dependent regulator of chromatin subfamily A3